MNLNPPMFSGMSPASPMAGFAMPNPATGLLFQQAMMMQMMSAVQMLFQQILGSGAGGGAMAPASAGFGRANAASGVENFLGGSHRSRGRARGRTSAPSSAGPTTDLSQVRGTEFGKRFAAEAEKTARRINTPGLCLKGVNDTMQAMGMPVQREASAYMALDNFRNNKRFQEVKVSKDQLKSLPAGAVVIWDKGSGLPHGHISVSLGNGREASSTVRDQLRLSTNFHVFVPKG